VADDLTLRPLEQHEWAEAMSLAARAFHHEPFMVEMFGADPIRRFRLANDYYRSSPWHDDQQHLGAFIGDRLVGFCVCSPPGHCRICTDVDPTRPPDDELHLFDWEFKVSVQIAHADHDGHAWISRVVVDSVVRGAGVGRTLMGEALGALRSTGAQVVLLECEAHRENFYAACGFHRVRTFPDPAGPDAVLMRADLARP
jgi:ribosomal protein S18 acetylase RimI-like enzyme